MKVVGVITLKGGSGKTSLAMNMACAWGMMGVETRLVDLDPQKSATEWGLSAKGPGGVCMLPTERGHFGFRMGEDVLPVDGAEALKNALERMPDSVERVVVDTPPNLDSPPVYVGILADVVLVPVEADLGSVRAARKSVAAMRAIQGRRGGLPHILIVPNKIDKSGITQSIMEHMTALGEVTTALPVSNAVRDAVAGGTHIFGTWYGRKFAVHVYSILNRIEELLK